MKKLSMALAAAFLGATFAVAANVRPAYAASKKADCDAVMKEVNSGAKKTKKAIAKDLGIPASSVYRCIHRSRAAKAKTAAKPSASAAKKSN